MTELIKKIAWTLIAIVLVVIILVFPAPEEALGSAIVPWLIWGFLKVIKINKAFLIAVVFSAFGIVGSLKDGGIAIVLFWSLILMVSTKSFFLPDEKQ